MLKYFIIFTNITINNTYIFIATPTVHVHRANRWNGPCRVPGWRPKHDLVPEPGGHRAMLCSGRAKSSGRGPQGHV